MASNTLSAARPVRIALAAGVAGLALLASPVLAPGHAQANTPLLQGQTSLADLVEKVMPAVVNIAAVTTNDQKGRNLPQLPQLGPDTPFGDLFEEFFNRRNQQGERQAPQQRRSQSAGSGFVVDASGIVVTNNHVIGDANEITVIFNDGLRLKAEVIGKDSKVDLAVLRVKHDKPLPAVKFGDSDKMRIGDPVMAIGNPFGLGGSVSSGIVSARNRDISQGPYDTYIQTDAAINKGNSGGPLFNMAGEVIGINTAILSPTGGSVGIGFAVPSTLATNVVDQLKEFGETRRGWLGVRIQPVTDEVAESLGLDSARGALVSGVVEGGPIANGEIRAGDVILRFDGQPVSEMRDLPRAVAESAVGKQVEVVVLRDGKEETVKVTLGRLEDNAEDAAETDEETVSPEDEPMPEGNAPEQQGEADGQEGPVEILGITIATLDEVQRGDFAIAESVEGVVVTAVEAGSAAAEKGLKPGDVIVEVGQDFVDSPEAVIERITVLKSEGRRNAHMMIADPTGALRFLALPME